MLREDRVDRCDPGLIKQVKAGERR